MSESSKAREGGYKSPCPNLRVGKHCNCDNKCENAKDKIGISELHELRNTENEKKENGCESAYHSFG